MSEALLIWTIYDHPADFPNAYVARKFAVLGGGHVATNDIIVSPELDLIRTMLRSMGLTVMARDPLDDSNIVESWL